MYYRLWYPDVQYLLNLHTKAVARPELLLEVQPAAKAAQLPPSHDPNAVTQNVGFLHAVCCQHDGTALLD